MGFVFEDENQTNNQQAEKGRYVFEDEKPSYPSMALTGFKEGVSGALKFYEAPFKPIARAMGIPPGLEASEWIKPSEEETRRAGEANIPKQVVRGLFGVPGAIAKYGPISAVAGPIAGFALPETVESVSEGKPISEVARKTAEGAAMGAGFKYLPPGLKYRVPGMAALFGGQSAYEGLREGLPIEEALKGSIAPATVGGILGVLPHRGPRLAPRPGVEPPPPEPPMLGVPEVIPSVSPVIPSPTLAPSPVKWGVPRLGDRKFRGYGAETREVPGMEALTETPLGPSRPEIPSLRAQVEPGVIKPPSAIEGMAPSGLSPTATFFDTPVGQFEGYAWRSMGAKEYERLMAGEKTYGGKSARKGNYLAPTPESAGQYQGKGRILVEFGGVEKAEGETVSNLIGRDNITKTWKLKGIKTAKGIKGEEWVEKGQKVEKLSGKSLAAAVELDPEISGTIQELRGIIQGDQPGGVLTEGEGRYGSSQAVEKIIGMKGVSREQALTAIDKGLKGQKLGINEQKIFDSVTENSKAIIGDRKAQDELDRVRSEIGRADLTKEDLTKHIDDEIMGLREQLNEEGYSNTEVSRAIEEAAKGITVEGTPTDIAAIEAEIRSLITPKVVTPALSATAKDQFNLPGMKQGIVFPTGGKEVTPTLEGTPLMEAARKAELEKTQPGLFGVKPETIKPKTTEEALAKGKELTKEQAVATWEEYKSNISKPMPEDFQEASNVIFENQMLRETVESYLGFDKLELLTPKEIDQRLKVSALMEATGIKKEPIPAKPLTRAERVASKKVEIPIAEPGEIKEVPMTPETLKEYPFLGPATKVKLPPEEQRVQDHIVSKVEDARNLKEKVRGAFDNFYYYAINKLWPVEKETPQGAAALRLSGPKGYGLATTMLEKGIPDPKQIITEGQAIKWIGEGLEPILRPIVDAKELGSFVRYGVSKRAIEKAGQGVETGVDINDAKAIVNRYENQMIGQNTYGQHFEKLGTFQDNILQYYRDSGMLSLDAYNQIKAKNLMYFPFYRAVEELGIDGVGSGIQPRSAIRKMMGGKEKILDPIDSIVKNTYNLVMNAEKNMALREFIKSGVAKEILPGMPGYGGHRHAISLYEMKKSGFFQDMLEDANLGKRDAQGNFRLNKGVKGQLEDEIVNIFRPNFIKGKENMFVVYDQGKPRIFEVDPQLGRALHGMDKEPTNLIVKILNYPTQWLRAGAILSPEFMARNPIRDWFSAMIYAKHGFNPWKFFEGLADAGGKSDLFYKWLMGGGAQSSFVSLDRVDIRQNAKQLLSKKMALGLLSGNDYKEIIKNLVTHPVEGLRILSELSEMGTRLGGYKRALTKGMTQQEAILQSRESTIDFSRIGAKSKALNMIIAFWNANVQGLDKLGRQLNFINKENRPVALRTFARATATITIPSLLLAWANQDDPRVQELPEWQKALFWIIPTENHIWRIPKPFELGIIFGTIPEYIMRWMRTDDPKTFENIGNALTSSSAPGMYPTALLPFLENWANKSKFTDRPIVPRGKETLLPQYQYQPYTTETAKKIGNLISKLPLIGETGAASPAKIENLVRGWTGGLGMHALRLAGGGLKVTGISEERVEPSKTVADIPGLKAFVSRYPGADARSIHDFYETYNKVNSIRSSARTLREQGKIEEATSLIVDHKDVPVQSYRALNRIHRTLSKMREAIDRVYSNSSMTPEDKRKMIDQIYLQMIAVAKNSNERLGGAS